MVNAMKLKKELNKNKNRLLNEILYLQKINNEESQKLIKEKREEITKLTHEYRKAVGKPIDGKAINKKEERDIKKQEIKFRAENNKNSVIYKFKNELGREGYEKLRKEGYTYQKLADLYNCNQANIYKIVKKLGWHKKMRDHKLEGISVNQLEKEFTIKEFHQLKYDGYKNQDIADIKGCTLNVLKQWIFKKKRCGELEYRYHQYKI